MEKIICYIKNQMVVLQEAVHEDMIDDNALNLE